jgi:hypothetical protein
MPHDTPKTALELALERLHQKDVEAARFRNASADTSPSAQRAPERIATAAEILRATLSDKGSKDNAASVCISHNAPSQNSLMREKLIALRESFRRARAAIEGLDDIERQVGLASLRLEAAAIYKQLTTTAPGVPVEDVRDVLKEFTGELVGGEIAEWSVGWLDARAASITKGAISAITTYLIKGVLLGGAATIVGVVVFFGNVLTSAGEALTALVLSSGAVARAVMLTARPVAEGSQKAWIASWQWASDFGRRADLALEDPRRHASQIWAECTTAPWRLDTFTAKARGRVQLLVGAAWALCALGLVLVAFGAFRALGR